MQPPSPDCMIVESWGPPPAQALVIWERMGTPTPCSRNMKRIAETDHDPSPRQSARNKKNDPTPERSGSAGYESEDGLWEHIWPSTVEQIDEEVTRSPSMRNMLTWLKERRLLTPSGGASRINGPVGTPKPGWQQRNTKPLS